jgi:hypothetical protein
MIRLSVRYLIATATALVGLGTTPQDVVVAGAASAEQVAPRMVPGDSAARVHPPTAAYLASCRSWDVDLIHHCGYWSQLQLETAQSAWPLPAVRDAEELGAIGASLGVIDELALAGDLFLQYNPRQRKFVHAGIVTAVLRRGRYSPTSPYVDVATIEGDTNAHGGRRGGSVERLERRLSHESGDRFLRWAALMEYNERLALAGAPRWSA